MIFVGLCVCEFFAAFVYIPACSEMVESVKDGIQAKITREGRLGGLEENQIQDQVDKKIKEVGGQLSDKASALRTMSFSIGAIIAPLLGGSLADRFGYGSECDIVSALAIFLALMYFGVVFLPNLVCARARRISGMSGSKNG